jgi:hypothetical protein
MADENYLDVLNELGFSEAEHESDDALQAGGPYVVHSAHGKGDIKVICEQNSHPDQPGSETVVTYPKVLVVESPKARVSVRPVDTDALRDVIEQLS